MALCPNCDEIIGMLNCVYKSAWNVRWVESEWEQSRTYIGLRYHCPKCDAVLYESIEQDQDARDFLSAG